MATRPGLSEVSFPIESQPVSIESVTASVLEVSVSSNNGNEYPVIYLVPVAHQPSIPETYSALTAAGGRVASAYLQSHSSLGSLSATVDSAALANVFGLPPTKLHIFHNSVSALYRVSMWGSCSGIPQNSASGLLARSQYIYVGDSRHFNISARAVFGHDGTPIGQGGTSANGMVYFGW